MFTKEQTEARFYKKMLDENTLYSIMGKRLDHGPIYETAAEHTKYMGFNVSEMDESQAIKLAFSEHYADLFESLEASLLTKYDGVLPQSIFEQVDNSKRVLSEMTHAAENQIAKKVGFLTESEMIAMNDGKPLDEGIGLFGAVSKSVFGGIAGYMFGGGLVAASVGAIIPMSMFTAMVIAMPHTTNMRIRRTMKDWTGKMSNVAAFMMSMPKLTELEKNNAILDDITLHRDVERKFKKNYDIKEAIESLTSFCNKKIEVESPEHMKINLRSQSKMKKAYNTIRGTFKDDYSTADTIAEYRECIMTRMVSLYQVLFLGVFVQYIEYDSAKKVITGSYETKLMFSQFKQLGKQDKKFQKQFEVLVQLRNIISDYVEILEKTHVPRVDKNDEVAEKVEKMLVAADKDIERAVRNNIDKLEIDNAKQAFDAQIADLDVLAVHKDPYGKMKTVDDEKEDREEDKKSDKAAANKYGYNLV